MQQYSTEPSLLFGIIHMALKYFFARVGLARSYRLLMARTGRVLDDSMSARETIQGTISASDDRKGPPTCRNFSTVML
jgi:hypothetical protein